MTVNWKSLDIEGGGKFFTDSNGVGMVKRNSNEMFGKYFRDEYMKPSGNYYPVTSAIMIEDDTQDSQMLVMNDRPQGGSAYFENRIELMINRRGYSDD